MVKIFVGNVQEGSRTGDLRTMFEKYGPVSECDILTNFGFVHMEDEGDARAAVKGLDGAFFSGSTIKVEMSHGKSKGGGRGRGGRGGGSRGPRGPPRDRRYDYGDRRSRGDPYRDSYSRDPYRSRDPYPRDPYDRDPYAYERRLHPRDPYDRRSPRDPYLRDPYSRDPYSGSSRDPYGPPRDPYTRDRSPIGRGMGMDDYPPHRRSYSSPYDLPPRAVSPPTRRY